MLQANLVTAYLQLSGSGDGALRAALPQASLAFPRLSAGQAVSALILEQVSPDLFLADIDGQHVQLNLPITVAPGEQVSLRLIRTGATPQFELYQHDPPSPRMPPALSGAAQLIQSLLADDRPDASTPTGASRLVDVRPDALAATGTPLLSAAPGEPKELAVALRTAVSQSGLFYESHLAAWAAGARPLALLQREPQAEWKTGPRPQPGDIDNGDPRAQIIGVPEEARPILRQQLHAAENQRLAWSGMLWPGQTGTLEIADESPRRDAPFPEATWRTSFCLRLRHLGELRVDLNLRGDRLVVAFSCVADESAAHLRSDLPQLRACLEAAGLAPTELRVIDHGIH